MKSSESEINDLLFFYEVKLSPEERKGRDVQELEKAQEALWGRIRTGNLIERILEEVKGRTRPMGVFGNRSSMEQIHYAVFFHCNSKGHEMPSLFFYTESLTQNLKKTI